MLTLPRIRLCDPPFVWVNTPPWLWKVRTPAYYNLWYSLDGRGEMVLNGKTYNIRPGRVFLIPPHCDVFARQEDATPTTNFAAHFVPVPGEPDSPLLDEGLPGVDVPVRHVIEERLHEMCARSRQPDPTAEREVEAMLYLVLADLMRLHHQKRQPFDRRIEDLLSEIDSQPGKYSRIEELCAITGLSPAHLRRHFMKRVDLSPIDYIIKRRLDRACNLLVSSPLRVSEIALSIGYDDPFYFSRQFKARFGLSPRTWRSQALKNHGGSD